MLTCERVYVYLYMRLCVYVYMCMWLRASCVYVLVLACICVYVYALGCVISCLPDFRWGFRRKFVSMLHPSLMYNWPFIFF